MTPIEKILIIPRSFPTWLLVSSLQALDKYFPNKQVHFLEERRIRKYDNDPEKHHDLRDRFAWFMRYALVRDLPDIYEDYQKQRKGSLRVSKFRNIVDNIVKQKRNKKTCCCCSWLS